MHRRVEPSTAHVISQSLGDIGAEGLLTSDRIVAEQEIAARRGSITCSYQFLSRYPSMDGHFLEGYSARSVRETVRSRRVERTVYEHIGTNKKLIRETAEQGGLIPHDQLPRFHQRLLRIDEPFR